jgi:hypothetical protein
MQISNSEYKYLHRVSFCKPFLKCIGVIKCFKLDKALAIKKMQICSIHKKMFFCSMMSVTVTSLLSKSHL